MSIEDKVIAIIRDNTEARTEITQESDLRLDLHLDSFGTLMIVNAIEESFSISIDDGDFRELVTVADVVTLLKSKYHCA